MRRSIRIRGRRRRALGLPSFALPASLRPARLFNRATLPFILVGAGILVVGAGLLVGKTIVDLKNKADWAKFVFDLTGALPGPLSVRSRLMVLAHAGYESGWGQSGNAAKHTNGTNIFNITAGEAWVKAGKPTVRVVNADKSTDAAFCARQGKAMNTTVGGVAACYIDQIWRNYPDLAAALADYWLFLGAGYPQARAALVAGDVVGFVQKLGEGGYYDKRLLDNGEYLSGVSGAFAMAANYIDVTA